MSDWSQGPDDLAARLRELRVDRPASDFSARLRARLTELGAPERPGLLMRLEALAQGRGAWFWPATGVLAGAFTFALFALVSARSARLESQAGPSPGTTAGPITRGDVPPTFVVPSAKVAVIKLAFSADVDVEDVTFEVTLPEGLAFWSRGQALAERTFRWPGRLHAGENQFPVAVRGERPGLYRVRARAEISGRSEAVEHDIWLEVRGEIGMIRRTLLGAVLVAALGSSQALAEEPPARQADPSPVRAGKTTVTVIDENESVDDVVTRVRAERSREGQAERRSGDQPVLPRAVAPAPGDRPTARPQPAGAAVRRAIRDARAAGEPRPAQVVRERIRERITERKPARPRAEPVSRPQRNR